MFCKNCGSQIADAAVVCPKCGVPVSGKAVSVEAGASPVKNHMVGAILCTLFCCLPCGIVAIVKASQVNTKLAQGDVAGAENAAQSAKTWILVAVILGVVVIFANILIQVIAAIAAAD